MDKTGLDILGDVGPISYVSIGGYKVAFRSLAALVGGAAGAFLWRRHRVLGALGGLAVGRNAAGLFKSEITLREAAESLGTHAVAIFASLKMPKGAIVPALGYLGGGAAAGAAVAAIRGEQVIATDHIVGALPSRDVLVGMLPEKAA